MPLARFKELAELVVTADDLDANAGQRSGGAMRSSAKANRSNRRKSPYAVAAATPTAPSGISPALAALGMGSVTRRRSTKFRAAVLVPEPAQLVVPVMHGAGGARGPLERQLAKEAKFSSKRAAQLARLSSCGDDPARALPQPSASPRKSPRTKSPWNLGGRSVEQWRDEAFAGFVGSDPAQAAAPGGSAIATSTTTLEALRSGVGKHLPPLRGVEQLERKRRLAARANEAKQREAQTTAAKQRAFGLA
jgi:hypothetical protein